MDIYGQSCPNICMGTLHEFRQNYSLRLEFKEVGHSNAWPGLGKMYQCIGATGNASLERLQFSKSAHQP